MTGDQSGPTRTVRKLRTGSTETARKLRTRSTETVRKLRTDRRARVPFAMIAVLLLLSSVAFVGVLETRDSGETNTNVALALDQTDSAIQTAIRDGAVAATSEGASGPITDVSSSRYGEALDEERPFQSYVAALVYLEVADRFESISQRVGDVETTVSLPAITDPGSFEAALENVSISPEREAGEPNGLVQVELQGITVTARRDGTVVDSRRRTVEVTVVTPVFQQHARTQEFQERLDASVTDTTVGFSHRFNARMYGLGWLRGYAQYGGAPVTEVIGTRHIEPAANSALYRTQQDVFGAADPTLGNAVRRGWFCMAAQDAEELYGGYTEGDTEFADDICEASEWVLGDRHSGELPEAPETLDLLAAAPGMDAEQTIGVNETAYLPLRELLADSGEHSIDAAIERAFTMDMEVLADIEREELQFSHQPPTSGAVVTDRQRMQRDVSVTSGRIVSDPEANTTFYRFEDFDVAITVRERATWHWREGGKTHEETTVAVDTVSAPVTVNLTQQTAAPELLVSEQTEQHGVAVQYERGPQSAVAERTVPTPPGGFVNYARGGEQVAQAIIGGSDASSFETWLKDRWSGVTQSSDLTLSSSQRVTLDIGDAQKSALVATLVEDITAIQERVSEVTHTFERTDLITDGSEAGPFGQLVSEVEAERDAVLARNSEYENVGQLVAYEVRTAYFERLIDDLAFLESAHREVMGGLDEELEGIDGGLESAFSFLRQGTSATGLTGTSETSTIDSPELMPTITYEVSGSPTYLAGEAVTTTEVPAVPQNEQFAPFASRNRNFLTLPYESIVNGVISKLFDFLDIGGSDTELTLRAAGEAQRAGELAAQATTAADGYASADELTAITTDIDDALESALGDFTDSLGERVTTELYDLDRSGYTRVDHPATGMTQSASETTLRQYDDPAMRAIAVGGGNATDPLVTAISQRLDDQDLERPRYAENLSGEEWQAVVASAVRPAITNASASASVTLDGVDDIERLDTLTREALGSVSDDIISERLAGRLGDDNFDLSEFEGWVSEDSIDTPVRVPAGLPLLPLPTHWFATMNIWDIEADGHYARFEVTANVSAPGRSTSTTYVRENATVEHSIAGESRRLGSVEPIAFDGRSILVVVVPPGGIGVGDRDDEEPQCSETYPITGQYNPADARCGLDEDIAGADADGSD